VDIRYSVSLGRFAARKGPDFVLHGNNGFDDNRHPLRDTRGVGFSSPQVRVRPGARDHRRIPVLERTVPHRARPIILAQSGIGKVNAATLATIMFTTFGCEDLIYSGVAGALSDLEVGSVVLVTSGATHDYGLVSNGVFTCVPAGDLPLPGIAMPLRDLPRVTSHVEETMERLRHRMADKLTVHLGAVLSGDVFINCPETRSRLQALGGDIVDMESAAVLEVAHRFSKGGYIIRTISDGAGNDSHFSYTEMVAIVAHNSAICVEELLKIVP
jgi:adenosylhomocysteine nucleosidase